MWILPFADEDGRTTRFRIPSGSIKTIGRAPSADIILDTSLVSRLHCRLEAGTDCIHVIDLSSTNGTFINDARIERGQVTAGDRLRVGRTELQVERLASEASDADAPTAEE
jgi:pSer/pThr/pTyr-binding forkhead associated (FHA) protein